MELFHTSPSKITEINASGRFGSFLCFAANPYAMSESDVITYTIEIDDDAIIESSSLFYHDDAAKLQPLVERVMKMTGSDEDEAIEMIEQKTDCGDAETSWDIQAITCQAAKMLGFRGVTMQDEQGRCYMIDMAGQELDLRVKDAG